MPRLVALEWGNNEARLAVAELRRGELVLEHAFVVPLGEGAPGGEGGSAGSGAGHAEGGLAGAPSGSGLAAESAAAAISQALSARGLARSEVLVALGRASTELKLLTLPAAPDEELPDLVRFQAQSEFNALTDEWALDFLPLSGADGEGAPRQVLAAAVAPEVMRQIQTACDKAELRLRRVVLRPCAAASLVLRQESADRTQLLVDLLRDEADLTVLAGRQVVLLRSARLPGDVGAGQEALRPLLGEIRRTMAAAHNQLGGEKVSRLLVCGRGSEDAALAQRLAAELGLPAELFDPFSACPLSRQLQAQLPEHAGRFAPLVGMLLDEAEGVSPAFDFLHPRRRPPPPTKRKQYLGIAAAVLLVALGTWAFILHKLRSLDGEIADLVQQSAQADKAVERARQIEERADAIGEWAASEMVWLDELAELASDLPPAQEVVLANLDCALTREGAELRLQGYVKSASTVSSLEATLRDDRHRVELRRHQQDGKLRDYAWRFESTVVISAPEPQPAQQAAANSGSSSQNSRPASVRQRRKRP